MPLSQVGRIVVWLLAVCAPCAAVPARADSMDSKRDSPATITANELNRAASAGTGARFSVRLFDDLVLSLEVARVERRETGGVTLSGRVERDDVGSFTLTYEQGLVSAGFWTRRGVFGLIPSEPVDPSGTIRCIAREWNRHAITQCAVSEHAGTSTHGIAPKDASYGCAACGTPPREHPAANPRESAIAPDPHGGASPRGASCGCPDDQSTIDVLVVYTTLARDGAGGAASLQARVQNAIDSTNDALLRSDASGTGVNRLQIRLDAFVEVNYAEQSPPPPNWINHLERVTNVDDGYLEEVHALRNQHAADLVCLVIDDPRFFGGAAWWAPYSDTRGFSCINWRGMGSGNLTMAHELGHNFGLAHEREVDSDALFDSAWAYWFNAGNTSYGTIMSYAGANFLPYYSNPTITDPGTGFAVGAPLSAANASWGARIIQQTRWTLANFRASGRPVDCNGNGVPDTTDIANGTSQDTNANCRPDECELRWHVDANTPGEGSGASWTDSVKQLANATVLAALPCSNVYTIWVADGVYKPDAFGNTFTADRFADFTLRSHLALYGGFQGLSRPGGGETSLTQRPADPNSFPSILSGEIASPVATDNSYSVVTAVDVAGSALLDGFTIERGYADWSGAGVYAQDSNISIANGLFRDNRSGSGGGVFLEGASNATFTNCTFENNTAAFYGGGAIGISGQSFATIHRSTFRSNNAAWGGAISSGGGTGAGGANIRSSAFSNNIATVYNGGALDFDRSILTLANSLLYANTSTLDGGAVWTANQSTVNVVNCTIASNTAGTFTGGLVASFDAANIASTIFWNNTGTHTAVQDRQLVYFGATGQTRYSRVQGWTGLSGGLSGPGNSGANPMFTNAGAGDYSLMPGSSCIDAGDTPALLALSGSPITLDIRNNTRRVNDPATTDSGVGPTPIVDIGAAEFQIPACRADFNHDNVVNSQDFFDFLGAFFSLSPSADFNTDGSINSQDFFDFISAFFGGC